MASWLIDHLIIDGGPGDAATWTQLSALLGETWPHASGVRLGLARLGIDTGYEAPAAWARRTGTAEVLAVKGVDGFNRATPGVERSTLATSEAVEDAASILATFRSVAGETFTPELKFAQDMALRSSAIQLSKAFKGPVLGLTALRRVTVSFSASQREVIATLVEPPRPST